LARIYFETELEDRKRAEGELDRALELEPDNVKYMVALMQSLDIDSWNFFQKRAREIKRNELAAKILEIDSTNAFAHQTLGEAYIRDFWRYRNAVVYPGLLFQRDPYLTPTVADPLADYRQNQRDLFEAQNPGLELRDPNDPELGRVAGLLDPQAIMMSDQFDIDALEAQGINVQSLVSRADEAYEKAIVHLYASLDSDPRQRDTYTDLMKIFALKGDYQEALKMLEQMYLFFPDDPDTWTYLGLAHHSLGNNEQAAKVFEKALPLLDQEAYNAYNSLDIILTDAEKKEYERDEVAYAARYWTSKDPRYLTPYNERKLEHYARLTYADLLYSAPGVDLRGWNTQRGQIIVRYGPPVGDVVIIPKSSSGVNASTREAQIAGNQLDAGDQQTREGSQILTIARDGWGFDMFEEANTYNIWDYGDKKFVFEDPFRNGEYRLYSPSASDISQGALPWANDYAIKAAETFREEPESYEYEAPGRQIQLPFLVSSFKNMESNLTDVYVNYGVPVNGFQQGTDLLNVTANTGTFVVGENKDMLVEQRRTIYGLRTSQVVQFQESNLWIETEKLRVPAGSQEVSVEFETAGGGTVGVQRRDVDVLDFSGDGFQLSDLLLAYRIDENENGAATLPSDILRNGLSIMPAPWSVFSTTQPIYLYFEVYNLARDANGVANYQIEAALAPKKQGNVISNLLKGIFGGGEDGVAVSTPVQVSSSNDGQYLILDASNQEPGVYTLVLRITDQATGRHLERDQDLFLE
jgi:GWxTD domain-containing protein